MEYLTELDYANTVLYDATQVSYEYEYAYVVGTKPYLHALCTMHYSYCLHSQ